MTYNRALQTVKQRKRIRTYRLIGKSPVAQLGYKIKEVVHYLIEVVRFGRQNESSNLSKCIGATDNMPLPIRPRQKLVT